MQFLNWYSEHPWLGTVIVLVIAQLIYVTIHLVFETFQILLQRDNKEFQFEEDFKSEEGFKRASFEEGFYGSRNLN